MAAPKAYFYAKPNGLEVSFFDRSVKTGQNPVYAWSFGDGSSSSDADPIHTYESSGYYQISLSYTDSLGTSTISLLLYISESGIIGTQPIIFMVKDRLPDGVEISDQDIYSRVRHWQNILHASIPSNVSYEDRHDEYKYSELENSFITRLVLRDSIIDSANQYLFTLGGGSSAGAQGDVKKITTGPADAEWFSASSSWYSIMRPGSLWDQILKEACYLANILGVKISGCEGNDLIMAPSIQTVTRESVSPDNQFTYQLDLGFDTVPSMG